MENINKPSTSIKNWAADDRPREKLQAKGPASLSDSELLAILINHGNGNRSALDLARDILKLGGNNLNELGKLSINDLQLIDGIGPAKAVTISAALELGRRRHASLALEKEKITGSAQLANFLQVKLKDYGFEVFAVVYLNAANKILSFEIISQGGITGTVADPRIIIRKALEEQATALVLCHNHPSGNLKPSAADELLTRKIKEAASFLDIRLLDHIIVSEEGYYSFADEGNL